MHTTAAVTVQHHLPIGEQRVDRSAGEAASRLVTSPQSLLNTPIVERPKAKADKGDRGDLGDGAREVEVLFDPTTNMRGPTRPVSTLVSVYAALLLEGSRLYTTAKAKLEREKRVGNRDSELGTTGVMFMALHRHVIAWAA